MQEVKFWHDLRQAVCLKLDSLGRHGLWCDGMIPEHYAFDSIPVRITGHAWIGVGPREHEKWKFTVVLAKPATDRANVEWASLMPPYGTTSWLQIDTARKLLLIEPGAAVPIAVC